jgi:glycosyltransferase involved in cell wall biosynthesis
MKILHVISSINPELGGPMEGLKNISSSFSAKGNHVEVVTLDSPESKFFFSENVKIHFLGPSLGKYNLNLKLIPWLLSNSIKFDVVLCNGIWQFHSLATWISSIFTKVPYFVFTHGALDPWFKYTYPLKHLKKCLYWPWAEYNVLKHANGVLFTTEEEKLLASKSFHMYSVKEFVINYGISEPTGDPEFQKSLFFEKFPNLREKDIFLFLSRIHPKKGCDILIKSFASIAKLNNKYHLVIAGPDQVIYKSELLSLIKQLNIEDQVTWTGMLKGNEKWGAIRASSCFVLPSHSENFGIVIAEAMACGVPVITTNKVNIWREVVSENAGLISEDDLSGFSENLSRWISLDCDEKKIMQENAKKCFKKYFSIENTVSSLLQVINQSIAQ